MSIFSRIFRKREKQKNPDGSKTVVVRDRFGNVRKIKHRDAAGYKQKQFFNRDGQLTKRKAKGPGMRRFKMLLIKSFNQEDHGYHLCNQMIE